MVKILQDIYIISEDGRVMFRRVYDEKVDAQLFGGFMSALNTLATQFNEDGLSEFNLGKNKYLVIKRNDIFFIANYNNKMNIKKAKQELENVIKIFFENYLVDLVAGWDGDLTKFEGFGDKIKDSLEDAIKTFEQAFW
ncbi:MAG: hypothetical protein ACTSYS_09770 [Promethearchaeota archaeon]